MREGDAVTLNKEGEDGAIYKKDVFYPVDKKQVVSKRKNMLAFLNLEIANHVFSLHSDAYSFLHASLLNHKHVLSFVVCKLF